MESTATCSLVPDSLQHWLFWSWNWDKFWTWATHWPVYIPLDQNTKYNLNSWGLFGEVLVLKQIWRHCAKHTSVPTSLKIWTPAIISDLTQLRFRSSREQIERAQSRNCWLGYYQYGRTSFLTILKPSIRFVLFSLTISFVLKATMHILPAEVLERDGTRRQRRCRARAVLKWLPSHHCLWLQEKVFKNTCFTKLLKHSSSFLWKNVLLPMCGWRFSL